MINVNFRGVTLLLYYLFLFTPLVKQFIVSLVLHIAFIL